nr:mitochondrial import inner membrane translocase subunit TIM22-like [Tanacetum cinerariifolium]
MGKEKQEVLAVSNEDPITQLKTKIKAFETLFKDWLIKHTVPVRAAIVAAEKHSIPLRLLAKTGDGAIGGAAVGFVVNRVSIPLLRPHVNEEVTARSSAVYMGSYAGILGVMKRLRGKEDVETQHLQGSPLVQNMLLVLIVLIYAYHCSFVTGFGAAVIYSLVCGIKGTDILYNGVSSGLWNVVNFKKREKSKLQAEEDKLFNETRGMLSSLGFDQYEKNFKKGMLTDKSLPDLQEIKIPIGARRLILDHIQREKKVMLRGRS